MNRRTGMFSASSEVKSTISPHHFKRLKVHSLPIPSSKSLRQDRPQCRINILCCRCASRRGARRGCRCWCPGCWCCWGCGLLGNRGAHGFIEFLHVLLVLIGARLLHPKEHLLVRGSESQDVGAARSTFLDPEDSCFLESHEPGMSNQHQQTLEFIQHVLQYV